MTHAGFILLKTIAIIYLAITLLIGFISLSNSKKTKDKLRFTWLTLGSMLSLIFVINI